MQETEPGRDGDGFSESRLVHRAVFRRVSAL
jgi:hypothetical protein